MQHLAHSLQLKCSKVIKSDFWGWGLSMYGPYYIISCHIISYTMLYHIISCTIYNIISLPAGTRFSKSRCLDNICTSSSTGHSFPRGCLRELAAKDTSDLGAEEVSTVCRGSPRQASRPPRIATGVLKKHSFEEEDP